MFSLFPLCSDAEYFIIILKILKVKVSLFLFTTAGLQKKSKSRVLLEGYVFVCMSGFDWPVCVRLTGHKDADERFE